MRNALGEALKLLAKRERFEAELRDLLNLREFSPEEVSAAIVQLQTWGVLSDTRTEQNFVGAHLERSGRGRLKLAQLFVSHGLTVEESEDLAKRHISDELESQRALAYLDQLPSDHQRASIAYRKLVSRGFDPEISQTVVQSRFPS